MTLFKLFCIASLALSAAMLPIASAANPLRRSTDKKIIAKELMNAKRGGASKSQLKKLKTKLKDEARVARAAGMNMATLKKAQARGASVDEIKAQINYKNLNKKKLRGVFRKKEITLSSVLFPGVSPVEYQAGETMETLVDTVNSKKTQIPFEFYKMPVCKPEQVRYKKRKRQNLGERLMGNTISRLSPFSIEVLKDQSCTALCTVDFDPKMIRRMRKLIQRDYSANLYIDGLPVYVPKRSGSVIRGYPIGSKIINEATDVTDVAYHNHLRLTIEYNSQEASHGFIRIVGFTARPMSIVHDPKNTRATCNEKPVRNTPETLLKFDIGPKNKAKSVSVTYSYEVKWIETEKSWTDRWDVYLLGAPDDSTAHHMSILNSSMIVIFLLACISLILIKTLRKDIAVYNDLNANIGDEGDELESTGWKLVHADVFRPPSTSPMALSVLVGSGLQIAAAIIGTLLLSQTRWINPAMKGQALSNIIMLYVLSGTVSGYVASRFFKFFGGKNWKLNTLLTAAFFPGVAMSLFLCLNIFLAFYGSAKSVSLFTIICAFFLWVCIASPLVFIGSFFGFKRDIITVPTKTNQIARVVPDAGIITDKWSCVLVGLVPFSCASIEVYFVMGAVWMEHYYYLMGYLLTISTLIGVTSALISIIMCYVRLSAEDHRWWWKAFADSASFGLWIFLYSIWFLVFRLKFVGVMPIVVYVTYMSVVSLATGLYCGGVSFLTTFWFNRVIYSAVKID